MTAPGGVPPGAGMVCYRHHERETGVACTRCGHPICAECMTAAPVGHHCPDCVNSGKVPYRRVRGQSPLARFARQWGPATTTLVGLNVVMYLVTAIAALPNGGGLIENSQSGLFDALSLVPACTTGDIPLIECASGSPQPWRLLSSAFLHFGLLHLAMNMLALLVLGVDLERYLGVARFIGLYVVAALFGGAAVTLFAEFNSQTVGASGGVFGLLGAAVVIIRVNRGDLRPLISVLAINLVISFLPGISLLGHLGGLIGGGLAAGALMLTRRRPESWQWAALGVLTVLPFLVVLS